MAFSAGAIWFAQVASALQIHYGFLMKEHLLRNQEIKSLEPHYLENHVERSLKLWQEKLRWSMPRAVTRIGIWLARLCTLIQNHAISISNYHKRLQKFQGRSTFRFGLKNALKIKKILRNSFCCNTDIERFLY